MSKRFNDAVVDTILSAMSTTNQVVNSLPKGSRLVKLPKRHRGDDQRAIIRCKSKGRTGSAIRVRVANQVVFLREDDHYWKRQREMFNKMK